ncbi:effector-associated domain 2-containing protein [Streptomyces sp. NPDC003011]
MGPGDAAVFEARGADSWRARVLGLRGTGVAGAGVLLDERTVLTCAHVVEAALRLPRTDEAPRGAVLVDFPASGAGRDAPVRAQVAEGGWLRSPPAGDLAVLLLEHPVGVGTVPAPVGRCGSRTGFTVSVFGHPGRVAHGLWAQARVVGAGGTHPQWRQLDGSNVTGARVGRGFSGAGVYDTERGSVIGVVASVLDTPEADSTRVAWMIPLDVLTGTRFGNLLTGNSLTEQEGSRQRTLHGDLWLLVECLLTIESVASDGGISLLSVLPGKIAWGVPRQNRPRIQLLYVVRRCDEFEEGPTALVTAVRGMEGETVAMERFTRLARRIWPHRLGDDG